MHISRTRVVRITTMAIAADSKAIVAAGMRVISDLDDAQLPDNWSCAHAVRISTSAYLIGLIGVLAAADGTTTTIEDTM